MQTLLNIITSLAEPLGERKARKCLQSLIAVSRRDPSPSTADHEKEAQTVADLIKDAKPVANLIKDAKPRSLLRRDDVLVLLVSFPSPS
jgi:hypothetical protein